MPRSFHHSQYKTTAIGALLSLLLFSAASCVGMRGTGSTSTNETAPAAPAATGLPPDCEVILEPLADPLEPLSRSFSEFNTALAKHILHPATQIWDTLVPDYLQERLGNFGQHIGYPVRLANHLMQGEWEYGWLDTWRFIINSTAGGLGFWDPATGFGAPQLDATFSQTLRSWSVPAGCYLNAPFAGPGSLRDLIGTGVDICLDPVGWCTPFAVNAPVQSSLAVNRFNREMPQIVNMLKSSNRYELSKIVTYFMRESRNSGYVIDRTRSDYDADQTFGSLLFTPKDRKRVYAQARNRHAQLAGGNRVPYTCWPKRGAKKIVIILPGIGGHRHSDAVYALAELFGERGCAAVALSSTFTPDYFTALPTAAPPGYLPEDARTLSKVIAAAVNDYRRHYRTDGTEECVIIGYSLGALNVLHLAALEKQGQWPDALRVACYLAINPPVRIVQALGSIDDAFAVPAQWPAQERRMRLNDVALRLSAWMQPGPLNPPSAVIPLTRDESRFVIGLYMRAILSETLLAQERRSPTGLFREDAGAFFRRNALFMEAMGISYRDYMLRVVIPWYQAHSDSAVTAEEMERRADLTSLTAALSGDRRIHVFQNRNDFLISGKDLAWYTECFGSNFHLFEQGGHIGNLASPDYQRLISGTALAPFIIHP